MSPDRINKLIPYALLITVVFMLYSNTLWGGFVWDDNLFTSNQVYWSFDFRRIFFSLANGLEYQPVRDLTYLFDIAVWHGSTLGFHLTNLFLFSAIVILAYRLAEKFSLIIRTEDNRVPEWFVPLLTVLIFTVHPLKSEVVAWITQRNTLLATFFFVLSLLCFLRFQEKNDKRAFIFSLGAFSLAILSKAIIVILPLLLLFIMLFNKRSNWRRIDFWLPLVPFFHRLRNSSTILYLDSQKISDYFSGYLTDLSVKDSLLPCRYPFSILRKVFGHQTYLLFTLKTLRCHSPHQKFCYRDCS